MRLPHRPTLLIALTMAVLALLLSWMLWSGAVTPDLAAGSATAGVAAAPSRQALSTPTAWQLLQEATAAANAASVQAIASHPWAALMEAEARWCARASNIGNPRALVDAANPVLQPAITLMLGDWVQALRAGSERDQALANWLDARPGSPNLLRQQALRSPDPFVSALALSRCGADAACQLELATRWRDLEPGNAMAQLAAHRPGVDPQLLLQRLAGATASRSYQTETLRRLSALPVPDSRGPLRMVAVGEWIGRSAAWPMPSFRPLIQACQGAPSDRAALCAAAGDRLWTLSAESVYEAMSAARVGSLAAPLDPVWAARRQRVEAAHALLMQQGRASAAMVDRHLRCESLSTEEQAEFADWLRPEWPRLQAQLPPPSP